MDDHTSKQNTRRSRWNIWVVVLVLEIVLLLTMTPIGAFLGELSGRDRNIIPLFYEGDREIVQEGGFSYIRVREAPGLAVQDGQARWEVDTQVDLFKTAYANGRGEVTVESGDGGKVIAPGTSNEYRFSLKNTGNISLDYNMRLDSVFTLSERELPVQVRLRSGDRWILGGENDWVRPDALTDVMETGTVAVNQYVTYTFEWQWPFESGTDDTLLGDLNDTLIGNAAAEQKVEFRLKIGAMAMVTPGAVPVGAQGEELLTPLTLWNVLTWVVFPGLLLGAVLLLLLFWRRPVYVTGFVPAEGELSLGRKKDALRPDGRFVFPKVYMGKHTFQLDESEYRIRLKRVKKREEPEKQGDREELPGIAFEKKDDLLVVYIGKKVKAIELYLLPGLSVRQDDWAAIDKDHNVITPAGVKEPDEDGENTTPGGLHIDRDGSLDVEEFAAAK